MTRLSNDFLNDALSQIPIERRIEAFHFIQGEDAKVPEDELQLSGHLFQLMREIWSTNTPEGVIPLNQNAYLGNALVTAAKQRGQEWRLEAPEDHGWKR